MDRFFKFLNSDRYQYAESEIYLKNNMHNQTAVFDVFLRTKNENDCAVVYGISDVLELIEILNETSYKDRKKYLSELSDNEDFIEYMANMKFTGSIRGVREGEVVFSNEPILTITASLIQGKILETPNPECAELSDSYSNGNIKNCTGGRWQGCTIFRNKESAGF